MADSAPEHLVVAGASLAGLRAVEAARATDWCGRITMIGAEPHLPYDRPPLSKAGLGVEGTEQPPFRTAAELRDELGVDLLLGTAATGLDTTHRAVEVGGREIGYDALVLATGATPRPLPGADDVAGVHTLRSLDDARAVRAGLERGDRVVVIGAGFIGAEVASAARARDLPVTIVEQANVPLGRSLGTEPGEICADLHRAAGTELRLGVAVTGLTTADGAVTGVRLDDGTTVPADLVVVGIGVRPATGWLEPSEVALHGRDGGVLCDATLATSCPGVWAAGDLAHVPFAVFDHDLMRLEHWTNAAEHGALAARNAVGGRAEEHRSIPYFWSDWYDHRLQFVGTPRADEVRVVGPHGPGGFVLYRRADRLVGAFTIDRRRDIMKLRRRIAERGGWHEALAYVDSRL